MKKITKRYLITLGIALVLTLLVILYESAYFDFSREKFRLFSDGFFVSGVLLMCAGLLCFVANFGGFDAFAFLGRKIRQKLGRKVKSDVSYYEYVERQRAKEKISLSNIFIVGICCIALGAAFAFFS